ncbi:hypothetical protein VULLAG_LOCUS16417 [Vulpes lagopus]
MLKVAHTESKKSHRAEETCPRASSPGSEGAGLSTVLRSTSLRPGLQPWGQKLRVPRLPRQRRGRCRPSLWRPARRSTALPDWPRRAGEAEEEPPALAQAAPVGGLKQGLTVPTAQQAAVPRGGGDAEGAPRSRAAGGSSRKDEEAGLEVGLEEGPPSGAPRS